MTFLMLLSVILVYMLMILLSTPNAIKMPGLSFCSKLDWGSSIISYAKTDWKKIRGLSRSLKFFSPEVVLYLYKSTIRLNMQYCCHILAGAPSCYLKMLDQIQKEICRTIGPSLAASLESLAHHQDVGKVFSIDLTYLYTLFHSFILLILKGGLLLILSNSIVSFLEQLDSGIVLSVDSF